MAPRTTGSRDLFTVAAVTVGAAVATIGTCVAVLAVQLAARRQRYNKPQPVNTAAAVAPAGHYSQAVTHRGTLYVSGLLPITMDGRKLTDAPFDEQVHLALANLKAIVEAGGSRVDKLVQCRVYITDVRNWTTFNEIFADFCGEATLPARCVVPVPALHFGLGLEIEAVAAL
jgi:2-iminobutanoate/2-iminopropanoate deaminase